MSVSVYIIDLVYPETDGTLLQRSKVLLAPLPANIMLEQMPLVLMTNRIPFVIMVKCGRLDLSIRYYFLTSFKRDKTPLYGSHFNRK